jgi:protein required for attachment to host cells
MTNAKLKAGTWVVVCDGRKWIILENAGDERFPNLRVRESEEQETPLTSEQGSDAPPRVFASVGTARSMIDQTDWHDENERLFAIKLARRLDRAVQVGEASSLIVVAPPRALGFLRGEYSSRLKRAIQLEIDKDFVRMPVFEIEHAIASHAG